MDKRIGFGFSQSCGNMEVLDVCVFGLRWRGWCRWGVDGVLEPGYGRVGGLVSVDL